jgi:hypothetical protein
MQTADAGQRERNSALTDTVAGALVRSTLVNPARVKNGSAVVVRRWSACFPCCRTPSSNQLMAVVFTFG